MAASGGPLGGKRGVVGRGPAGLGGPRGAAGLACGYRSGLAVEQFPKGRQGRFAVGFVVGVHVHAPAGAIQIRIASIGIGAREGVQHQRQASRTKQG